MAKTTRHESFYEGWPNVSSLDAQKLRESWEANADAWTDAVRSGSIESRRLVTDDAIVRAVLALAPASVLDLGCGEGWLARILAGHGVDVVGVDASGGLIEAAREAGGGRFEHCGYDELSRRAQDLGAPFDAVVCNFSLFEENLRPVLETVRDMLEPAGSLLIQTLHPDVAVENGNDREGWRTERFIGMGDGFRATMPWYFRKVASWQRVISDAGFSVEKREETRHPETGKPLSLLLRATLTAPEAP